MIATGTLVNAGAIIAGGLLGTLLRHGFPERWRNTLMQALGLSVLIIGLSGAMQGIFRITSGGTLDRVDILLMIISLVLGGLAGEAINIEDKLERLGLFFEKKIGGSESTFAEGFVTASLVFCVGAMAIVGALEDGLAHNPSTLFAKSLLDGVASVIFASTLGIGVAFSAIPILVYQGGITLMAGVISPWLSQTVITQTSLIGGVLIIGIGLNILDIKRIKVGNLLPAVLVPFLWDMISRFF